MDYETTVKKLISVFKSSSTTTSVDQLKEIELLWESINDINSYEHSNGQTIIATNKPANIKRTSSDLQQLNTNLSKKQKLTTSASSVTFSKPTDDLTSTSKDNFQNLKRKDDTINENLTDCVNLENNSVNQANEDSQGSSKVIDNENQNDDDDQATSNIDEYVIEMGLTCDTCKYVKFCKVLN
jgi:hypothetical protein